MKTSISVELVESIAKARGDQPVPRDFVTEALERVGTGKEDVDRYPDGAPSALGVYKIASRLYEECCGKSQK